MTSKIGLELSKSSFRKARGADDLTSKLVADREAANLQETSFVFGPLLRDMKKNPLSLKIPSKYKDQKWWLEIRNKNAPSQ